MYTIISIAIRVMNRVNDFKVIESQSKLITGQTLLAYENSPPASFPVCNELSDNHLSTICEKVNVKTNDYYNSYLIAFLGTGGRKCVCESKRKNTVYSVGRPPVMYIFSPK